MDSTAKAASDPVYQDFDPSTEWVREPLADTLVVYLPGFRKDQLKVQITSANNLKITGARQLNDNIWSRFRKEIPIPSNYDTNGIGAKYEKGVLYIRNPKLIVPASPAPESLKQKVDQPDKPQIKPQETPKPTKQESPKPEKPAKEELSKPLEAPNPQESPKPSKPTKQESPMPEKPAKEEFSKPLEAPKPQESPKPSKPLQEAPEPEKPMKLGEPSKPLEAPKSQSLSQETPKTTKEKSSKTEKPIIAEEKQEHEVRKRKVAEKAHTGEQEIAGNIEQGIKLSEITENGSYRFVMENYKKVISGLVKEMKNARNTTNIVVVILFGIVLGLYVKNAIMSFMKSEN